MQHTHWITYSQWRSQIDSRISGFSQLVARAKSTYLPPPIVAQFYNQRMQQAFPSVGPDRFESLGRHVWQASSLTVLHTCSCTGFHIFCPKVIQTDTVVSPLLIHIMCCGSHNQRLCVSTTSLHAYRTNRLSIKRSGRGSEKRDAGFQELCISLWQDWRKSHYPWLFTQSDTQASPSPASQLHTDIFLKHAEIHFGARLCSYYYIDDNRCPSRCSSLRSAKASGPWGCRGVQQYVPRKRQHFCPTCKETMCPQWSLLRWWEYTIPYWVSWRVDSSLQSRWQSQFWYIVIHFRSQCVSPPYLRHIPHHIRLDWMSIIQSPCRYKLKSILLTALGTSCTNIEWWSCPTHSLLALPSMPTLLFGRPVRMTEASSISILAKL